MLVGIFCPEDPSRKGKEVCFPMPTFEDAFAHACLAEVRWPEKFCVYDISEKLLTKIDFIAYANRRFGYIEDIKKNKDNLNYLESTIWEKDPETGIYHQNNKLLFPNPPNFKTELDDLKQINYVIDRKKLAKIKPIYTFSIDKNFRYLTIDNVFNMFDNLFGSLFSLVCESAKRMEPEFRIFDCKDVHVDGLQMLWYPAGVLFTKKYAFLFTEFAVILNELFDKGMNSKHINPDFDKFKQIMNDYFDKTEKYSLIDYKYLDIFDNLSKLCIANWPY